MSLEPGSLRAAVLRGFLWVGTGTFAGQFISWISTIVVIRLLEPADYGLMAMCTSFIWLLSLLSDLGIGASLVQAKEITQEEIRKVYGLVILCSLGFVVFGHFAAPLVAAFYDEPRLTALIRVMNVSFLLTAVYEVPQSIAIRALDFRLKATIELAAQVSGAILTVVLAWSGAGVWTLVSGVLLVQLLKAAGFNIPRRLRTSPLFDLRSIRSFVNYGLAMTGGRLAYYLYSIADTVVIGRLLGNSLLGTYSVAVTLAQLPSEKILPIVTQVTFASYSRIQKDRERIGQTILRTVQAVSYVAFPFYFLMAAVAPEAIALLLGEKWSAIVVPFQILCLLMPLKSLSPILPPAVFATGKPMVNLVNMAVSFVVMAAAFLVGVRFGILGVCLAWAIAYPFVFLLTSQRCLRAIDLTLVDMLREMWFPSMASVAIFVLVMFFKTSTANLVNIPMLTVLALSAAALYAALVLLFRREEYLRLKGFLLG
jgi:O-antigen/teichoic acid export membrane protein